MPLRLTRSANLSRSSLILVQTQTLNIPAIRAQFPILQTEVRGKNLVYLDNAATTQKPQRVIDRISQFYESENANSHRAVHFLSEVSTRRFEEARVQIARFLGARDAHECIFVRGCTEGINLVAATWGRANIGEGDEIILTDMEHHSNIVPWQLLAAQTGCLIKVVPVFDNGELDLDAYGALFSERTKLVSFVHLSNALGTINPAREIIDIAHQNGALVLCDAAQSIPHFSIDVQQLGADFLVFSGHKIYGPTGIGILWARRELLDEMPPYQGGGNMIDRVSWEETTWNVVPYKFEAGTSNMAGAIGLGEAVNWVEEIGLNAIAQHEAELLSYATEKLCSINGFRIIGTAPAKASVLSFLIDGTHPNDVAQLIDTQGVAVRSGHHCCMPLMNRYDIPGTLRASFAVYNTMEEVDKLYDALNFAREMLV